MSGGGDSGGVERADFASLDSLAALRALCEPESLAALRIGDEQASVLHRAVQTHNAALRDAILADNQLGNGESSSLIDSQSYYCRSVALLPNPVSF